ncbi:uncharacterized protein LOC135934568 isoform X2 [Cloeon dipterum]|uniref:uncharacterized protein LOC135934568 isoform X2 n=1 Tax=Cloeon dipterum TaxID=197152 RepID=UPI0032204772
MIQNGNTYTLGLITVHFLIARRVGETLTMRSKLLTALLIFDILCTYTFGQDPYGPSHVEVNDESAMENHGELMLMMEGQVHANEKEPTMELISSVPMKIKSAKIQQLQAAPQSPQNGMTSKEQFCMQEMTKCLASNMPNDDAQNPAAEDFQPDTGASYAQETVVYPTISADDTPGHFEPFSASKNNMGNVKKVVRPNLSTGGNAEMQYLPSLKCNSQNFIRMQDCCLNTPRDFFSGSIVYACQDIFPINPGIVLKEYNLNFGQLNDNSIDLSSSETVSGEALGSSVCFMDCIFRKRFLVREDGNLDFQLLPQHFISANLDRAWHSTIMQSVRNCSQVMHKFPPVMQNPGSSFQPICFTHPYLFQQCVAKSLRLRCPSPNKLTNSETCVEKRDVLQKCDIFQMKVPIPRF